MDATREAPLSYRSTSKRLSPPGLIAQAAREIWSRRRLIRYLVQADLKKKGADTILGNVWWVLDPLLQMLVYVLLVSVILERKQEAYPLFIFAAILPWKWFTTAVGDAITSVSSQDRLIKQLQFPKIVLPTAATVAGVVNFAFGFLALAGLLALFYLERATPYLALLPIIAVVQFAFTLAVAYAVSAVNVFYRDVGNVSRHALRLWFYLSPGLYGVATLKSIGDHYPLLIQLMSFNPFFILFNAYRAVIYDGQPPDWTSLSLLFVTSLGLLALATVFFKRVEPSFAKVL
ncbi:MAG TPA: ABC transporter permease [Candidatus Limnocylindrales bacterium]|nr:ABC transporter permease [Candidatus Limnocylindrales bacterium]